MENPVASIDMIKSTVSEQLGFTTKYEVQIRVEACKLIRNCCLLLNLPQTTSATAQTLVQRFYFIVSINSIPLFDLLAASIYLATKLEETHKRLKDIIEAMDQLCVPKQHIKYGSPDYFDFRDGIIQAELSILAKLGFNVHVEHPHGYLFNYISTMNLGPKFAQESLEYLNDSFATIVHCLYQPFIVACGIIHLTALKLNVMMPRNWFKVFDCELEDLEIITRLVLELYKVEAVKVDHYNKLKLKP